MSESDGTQFRIRVYLPTGYTCTLQLYGSATFAKLRSECWSKKSKDFGCSKSEARFRLFTTELFFNDTDKISYLVSIYPSFEGLGTIDRYSILLESPPIRGDKSMRDKMRIDAKKPIFWQGYLTKCSKPTGKGFWKKQYVVFQNETLMLYSSQDEFSKGKKAHKYIGIGCIVPQIDHRSCKTANKKWPLVLDVPQGQGTKAGIIVFAGDSQAVRRSFIEVISKYLFFKKCAMVLNILPCLYSNNYASQQGIFRIAGESTKIKALQMEIDAGNVPNFNQLITEKCANINIHNFTGLLKRQLRFMITPIIPETHYEAFIDIGRQLTLDKRIEQLNFVIKSLSSTSVLVLAELFRFLKYAIQFESKSKMGPTNFAIVIGPNILRTSQELHNPMKAIDDNKHMQTTIGTMVQYYDQILPNIGELYKFDRATNSKWKYGIIDAPNDANMVRGAPRLKSVKSDESGGFGLFDMTKNMQCSGNKSSVLTSDAMKQFSKSTGSNIGQSKPLVMHQNQINKVQLRSTHSSNKSPKNIAPSVSQSNNVDFRAVLKNKSMSPRKLSLSKEDSYHSHTMDFRAQMRQKKKPKNNTEMKQNHSLSESEDNANGANKAKLPPPNPIEVMSIEQKERQKQNTAILEIFQDFENNMAQYDEEIDFKQSFAESLVSQIMDLAENNKVKSANKYASQISNTCATVINAAKAHSEALLHFNQILQTIYSQMEDEFESQSHGNGNGGGISGIATNGTSQTPGNDAYEGDGDAYGDMELPQRIPSHSFGNDDSKGSHSNANYSLDASAIADAISGGLPRYQSAKDLAKSNEPQKKVAKALYDYPGGYRSNELTFHRGTSLIITKEKEGWVYGYYELEPSLTGWFPKSYVNVILGGSD